MSKPGYKKDGTKTGKIETEKFSHTFVWSSRKVMRRRLYAKSKWVRIFQNWLFSAQKVKQVSSQTNKMKYPPTFTAMKIPSTREKNTFEK